MSIIASMQNSVVVTWPETNQIEDTSFMRVMGDKGKSFRPFIFYLCFCVPVSVYQLQLLLRSQCLDFCSYNLTSSLANFCEFLLPYSSRAFLANNATDGRDIMPRENAILAKPLQSSSDRGSMRKHIEGCLLEYVRYLFRYFEMGVVLVLLSWGFGITIKIVVVHLNYCCCTAVS